MYKHVCIMGGSGFVGRYIVARLAKQGIRCKVLTRHRERHRDLIVLPTVELVEGNVHNQAFLEKQFEGCDAVINLIGILNEPKDNGRGFHRAHTELAQKVVQACYAKKINRLLHMSALHADAQRGPSYYLRTKGEAEELVHAARNMHVTSFRPSVIFGPGDSFFNNFASLLKLAPLALPLACANSRFAPVYVGDVADAFVKSLNNPATYDARYDLCGPHVYTLKRLVEYTAETTGLNRSVIGLGAVPSKLMANVFQHMPFFKPLTRDNYRSLSVDSVCQGPFPEIFNIEPASIEAIAPTYLQDGRFRNRYNQMRESRRV